MDLCWLHFSGNEQHMRMLVCVFVFRKQQSQIS